MKLMTVGENGMIFPVSGSIAFTYCSTPADLALARRQRDRDHRDRLVAGLFGEALRTAHVEPRLGVDVLDIHRLAVQRDVARREVLDRLALLVVERELEPRQPDLVRAQRKAQRALVGLQIHRACVAVRERLAGEQDVAQQFVAVALARKENPALDQARELLLGDRQELGALAQRALHHRLRFSKRVHLVQDRAHRRCLAGEVEVLDALGVRREAHERTADPARAHHRERHHDQQEDDGHENDLIARRFDRAGEIAHRRERADAEMGAGRGRVDMLREDEFLAADLDDPGARLFAGLPFLQHREMRDARRGDQCQRRNVGQLARRRAVRGEDAIRAVEHDDPAIRSEFRLRHDVVERREAEVGADDPDAVAQRRGDGDPEILRRGKAVRVGNRNRRSLFRVAVPGPLRREIVRRPDMRAEHSPVGRLELP
jgi:hypothetical protein